MHSHFVLLLGLKACMGAMDTYRHASVLLKVRVAPIGRMCIKIHPSANRMRQDARQMLKPSHRPMLASFPPTQRILCSALLRACTHLRQHGPYPEGKLTSLANTSLILRACSPPLPTQA